MSNSFHGGLSVSWFLFFSYQIIPKQPGEGSSLLISDLNSSIKYKGCAKTHRHSALRGINLTRGLGQSSINFNLHYYTVCALSLSISFSLLLCHCLQFGSKLNMTQFCSRVCSLRLSPVPPLSHYLSLLSRPLPPLYFMRSVCVDAGVIIFRWDNQSRE
jgi:hypothetical protein